MNTLEAIASIRLKQFKPPVRNIFFPAQALVTYAYNLSSNIIPIPEKRFWMTPSTLQGLGTDNITAVIIDLRPTNKVQDGSGNTISPAANSSFESSTGSSSATGKVPRTESGSVSSPKLSSTKIGGVSCRGGVDETDFAGSSASQ